LFPEVALSYSKQISSPEDLSSILLCVHQGKAQYDDVIRRLELIFANAQNFNVAAVQMCAIVAHFRIYVRNLWEEVVGDSFGHNWRGNTHLRTEGDVEKSSYEFERCRKVRRCEHFLFSSEAPLTVFESKMLIDSFQKVLQQTHHCPSWRNSLQAIIDDVTNMLSASGSDIYSMDDRGDTLSPARHRLTSVTLSSIFSLFIQSIDNDLEKCSSASASDKHDNYNYSLGEDESLETIVQEFARHIPQAPSFCVGIFINQVRRQGNYIAALVNAWKEGHGFCAPAYSTFLTSIDASMGEVLVHMVERQTRGCSLSSIWAQPLEVSHIFSPFSYCCPSDTHLWYLTAQDKSFFSLLHTSPFESFPPASLTTLNEEPDVSLPSLFRRSCGPSRLEQHTFQA
jgi:hypothetical protein